MLRNRKETQVRLNTSVRAEVWRRRAELSVRSDAVRLEVMSAAPPASCRISRTVEPCLPGRTLSCVFHTKHPRKSTENWQLVAAEGRRRSSRRNRPRPRANVSHKHLSAVNQPASLPLLSRAALISNKPFIITAPPLLSGCDLTS